MNHYLVEIISNFTQFKKCWVIEKNSQNEGGNKSKDKDKYNYEITYKNVDRDILQHFFQEHTTYTLLSIIGE